MMVRVVDGRLSLEDLTLEEANLLRDALVTWTAGAIGTSAQLEIEAGERAELARGRRHGKTQAARVAGELRREAAQLREMARRGEDLLRLLVII